MLRSLFHEGLFVPPSGVLSADIRCQPHQEWSQLQRAAWPDITPSWASKGPHLVTTWFVIIKAGSSVPNTWQCWSITLGPELHVGSTEGQFWVSINSTSLPVQLCILLLFYRFDPKDTSFFKIPRLHTSTLDFKSEYAFCGTEYAFSNSFLPCRNTIMQDRRDNVPP